MTQSDVHSTDGETRQEKSPCILHSCNVLFLLSHNVLICCLFPSCLQHKVEKVKHKSERNQWIALVNHLKAREQLPLVVFSFSRKKCQEAANGLIGLDLTTAAEKSEVRGTQHTTAQSFPSWHSLTFHPFSQIHLFLQNALKRLQGPDRVLPQVSGTGRMQQCAVL